MPPILSKPSKAAHVAIGFVTLGALLMVWSAIWFFYMYNHHTPMEPGQGSSDVPYYLCAVVFFSGLTVFVIGFALGSIGRAARRAEMPPEVSGAPTAQPAVTAQPVAQPMAMNNQAVAPGQPVVLGQPPVAAVAPVANTAPVR